MKPKQGPACNDIMPTDPPERRKSLRFMNMVALSNYYEEAGCPRVDSVRVGDVYRIPVRSPVTASGLAYQGLPKPPMVSFHEFELCEAVDSKGRVWKLWRKKDFK